MTTKSCTACKNRRKGPTFSFLILFVVAAFSSLIWSANVEAETFYRGQAWCERPIVSSAARGSGYKYDEKSHQVTNNQSRSRDSLRFLLNQADPPIKVQDPAKRPLYYQLDGAIEYHLRLTQMNSPFISTSVSERQAQNWALDWSKRHPPFPGEVVVIEVPSQYVCDLNRWKSAVVSTGQRVFEPDHPIFQTCHVFETTNRNEGEWVLVHEIPASYIKRSYPYPPNEKYKSCSDEDGSPPPSEEKKRSGKLMGKKSTSGGKASALSTKGKTLTLGGVNIDLSTLYNTVLEYLKKQFISALQAQVEAVKVEFRGAVQGYAQETYQDFLYWLNERVHSELGSRYPMDTQAFENEFLSWVNAPGRQLEQYVGEYLKEKSATIGWLIEAYQDEASWQIAYGLRDIWQDAKDKHDRFTRVVEETASNPNTAYADTLNKYGFSGPWIDKFKSYEGQFNTLNEQYKIIDASNIIIKAFQSDIPSDKISSLFDLLTLMGGVAEDSRIPIVSLFGQIVKTYGDIASKMLEQIKGLAEKLRQRQGYCVGVGTTNTRNDALSKDFGDGLLICPTMLSPDIYQRTLPNDGRIYFWVKDRFIEGQEKGGGLSGVRQGVDLIKAAGDTGYPGLEKYKGKEGDIELISKIYNIKYEQPEYGSGLPGLLKEAEEIIDGLAKRISALENGFGSDGQACKLENLHRFFEQEIGLRNNGPLPVTGNEWGSSFAASIEKLKILMATAYIDQRAGAYNTYRDIWTKLKSLSLLRLNGQIKDASDLERPCKSCEEAEIILSAEKTKQPPGCETNKADNRGEFSSYFLTDSIEFSIKVTVKIKEKKSETLVINRQVVGIESVPFVKNFSITIPIDLGGQKKDEFDFSVSITDKKTGNKISGAKVKFDEETKDAPDGLATYTRQSSMLAPEKSSETVSLSAEAANYKPASASYTIGELTSKLDKNSNLINLTISLEPEEKTDDQSKILIQKVADSQNVKPGEQVIYVYSVTNTGSAPLDKVKISDDKCAPVTYLRGAANYAGGVMAPNETWEYQCTATLNKTTENTATVEAYSPTGVKVTGQAKARVTAVFCPPPKVKVPYLLYMATDEAKVEVQNSGLRYSTGKSEYSDSFAKGTVMGQEPRDDLCVDPGSTVNAVISLGPKPDKPDETTPAKLTAEIDCGKSFEITAGDFIGKTCTITVKGWRSNTNDPVEIKTKYNKSSGIEASGDTSVPGYLMYVAGVNDYYDKRFFSLGFKARDNAPKGTTDVTITVSQKEAGEIVFPIRIAVLAKGQLPGSGEGIRPPAVVQTGSGGNYCVWRYKLFGDPPACFHFVAAVCGKYSMPDYEQVGDKMTFGEADARVGQLSRYFADQYGCSLGTPKPPEPSGPTTLTAGLTCGGAMEIVPGELSKSCDVIVGGWKTDISSGPVNLRIRVEDGQFLGKIQAIPGNSSISPDSMYTGGTSSYTFSEGFAARDNAPSGKVRVTITVSQAGNGQVSVPLDLLVLPKGATASSGPGVRPPAQVATGSGGNYCVWRYKLFGDPPPCFHFVNAVCGTYGPPNYELVGDKMTFGEGDARMGELSRYFKDQYGCTQAVFPADCTYSYSGWSECQPNGTLSRTVVSATPPGCKGTPVLSQPCIYKPPPPPPCKYEYWDWSDCQPDNTRSRGVKSSTPEGCEGTPVLTGPCTYTPPPPVLTRFGVFCSPSSIDQKGTASCKATGEYSNAIGTYVDLTARAAWTNGPTFEGKGRKEGSYPVTATLEGASDTATVTVMKDYDPNKDPRTPGTDKPVDPGKIKGPTEGFAAGPGQGTRPEKPEQPGQPPVPIPPEYTQPPKPPRPPDQPGGKTPEKPGDKPTKPGIDVTVVGTAPPGKCTIVSGQLVAVKGYKENIAGMTVVLTGPVSKTTSSSGGGAFSFQDLPAGKYVISVKQWNYGMTKADFVCESGKAVKVVMKGSCPYLYIWNGKTYEKENDIYSVARLLPRDLLTEESKLLAEKQNTAIFLFSPEHLTAKVIKEKSMRDDYRITRTLKPDNEGNYRLKIVEQATERSFTDWVGLSSIDHRKGTKIGIDGEGKPFLFEATSPLPLQEPIPLYNDGFLEMALPAQAFKDGFLSVTWQGFLEGKAEGHSAAAGRPRLSLQRLDPQGQWQTVDWVNPRDEMQESFFPLRDLGPGWDREGMVRLKAVSCQPEKYHRIDGLAWGKVLAERPGFTGLPLISAVKGLAENVLEVLSQKDGKALYLGPEEKASLVFKGNLLAEDMERSFIFSSEGFYILMPKVRIASSSN